MSAEVIKLLGTWSSPFVIRIKWALEIKGVQYEFIEEDLSNKSPLLLQYNPVYKKVPVLVHGGKPISESFIILEYIDETWKENPILPKDPYGRATARFLSKFGDDKCLPSIWQVFISKGKKQAKAIAAASENLKILEEKLNGGKFFSGEALGFADLSLGWIAHMVSLLEQIINQKMIDEVTHPLLFAWIQNFSSSEAIKGSFPNQDRMILKYRMLVDLIVTQQELIRENFLWRRENNCMQCFFVMTLNKLHLSHNVLMILEPCSKASSFTCLIM